MKSVRYAKKRDVKRCHKTTAAGGFGIKMSLSKNFDISYSFD